MKQLKQLFAVTLLVLALGIPAYAGQIDTPGCTDPPPPPPSASVAGEMITRTAAVPAPGDMEAPTLVTMELESILGVLALYVY